MGIHKRDVSSPHVTILGLNLFWSNHCNNLELGSKFMEFCVHYAKCYDTSRCDVIVWEGRKKNAHVGVHRLCPFTQLHPARGTLWWSRTFSKTVSDKSRAKCLEICDSFLCLVKSVKLGSHNLEAAFHQKMLDMRAFLPLFHFPWLSLASKLNIRANFHCGNSFSGTTPLQAQPTSMWNIRLHSTERKPKPLQVSSLA